MTKSNSRSVFAELIFIIVFVLILFTPGLKLLPYYTWFFALFGLIALFDKNFVRLIQFKCRANIYFINILIFSIIYNASIVPLSHGTMDFSYIPMLIGIILTLFRDVFLVYILHKWGKSDDLMQAYCKYFFTACCIYVLFTISFIANPEFKSFWLNEMLLQSEERTFEAYQFRYSLDGFAAFSSASTFAFACLFCCYRIAQNIRMQLTQVLCLVTLIVGCFFYGRISLIGMLLGGLIILQKTQSKVMVLKIMIVLVGAIIALLYVVKTLSSVNESFAIWQKWAFAFVNQLFVEKEITDYSATHMYEDMYFMPELSTLFFGDGIYTNSNGLYYMHTDVGFMRLICYSGLVGLLLAYSSVIFLVNIIYKYSNNSTLRVFIVFALILFAVLEMKGESYHRALMFLYPIFLIVNYQKSMKQMQ